jgi:hypothetical protein
MPKLIRDEVGAQSVGRGLSSRRGRTKARTTAGRGPPGADYFVRFQTNSNVTPEGVRGFENFISSAVMDVMIRR